jgi:hypothetical protein
LPCRFRSVDRLRSIGRWLLVLTAMVVATPALFLGVGLVAFVVVTFGGVSPVTRGLGRRRRRVASAVVTPTSTLTRQAWSLLVPREPGTGETRGGQPAAVPYQPGTHELRASGDWLGAERSFLVDLVGDLHRGGLWSASWRLAYYLAPFFELHAHRDYWRTTHARALAATRQQGHARGEALILRSLGDLHRLEGRPVEAERALRDSLERLTRLGDRAEQAHVERRLGLVYLAQGRLDDAEQWLERCRAAFEASGDARGSASSLRALGGLRRRQGRLDAAGRHLRTPWRASSSSVTLGAGRTPCTSWPSSISTSGGCPRPGAASSRPCGPASGCGTACPRPSPSLPSPGSAWPKGVPSRRAPTPSRRWMPSRRSASGRARPARSWPWGWYGSTSTTPIAPRVPRALTRHQRRAGLSSRPRHRPVSRPVRVNRRRNDADPEGPPASIRRA